MEICSQMMLDHFSQCQGCQNLDLIVPHIEMPAHLEMSGRIETNQRRSVGLVFKYLCRLRHARDEGLNLVSHHIEFDGLLTRLG
jgi:hypothetical protein